MSQQILTPRLVITSCLSVLLCSALIRPASAQPHQVMLTLAEGDGNVWDLAYSPDGKHLAIANGSTAEVWDVAARKKKFVCGQLKGSVRQLAFSSDGSWISIYDYKHRQIVCVDAATGRLRTRVDVETDSKSGRCTSVVLSDDGQRGVAGYVNGRVTIWNLPSGRTETTLRTTNSKVSGLSVSPNGQLLAVIGKSGNKDRLMLWDVETRQSLWSIESNGPPHMAFSPDGRTLATYGMLGSVGAFRIRLYDTSTGSLRAEVGKLPHNYYSGADQLIAFTPDGTKLLTATSPHGEQSCLDLWDVSFLKEKAAERTMAGASGLEKLRLLGKGVATKKQNAPVLLIPLGSRWVEQIFQTVAFNPVRLQEITFALYPEKDVLLSDLTSICGHWLKKPRRAFDSFSVASSPSSQQLALLTSDGNKNKILSIVDLEPGRVRQRMALGKTYIQVPVSFLHDAPRLITLDQLFGLRTWNRNTGELERRQLENVKGYIEKRGIAADGTVAFYIGHLRALVFWDVRAGKPICKITTSDINGGSALAISADGSLLAARYAGHSKIDAVDIYSRKEKRKLFQIHLPKMYAHGTPAGKTTKCDYCFSPDGQRLFCVAYHRDYSVTEIYANPDLEKIGYLACVNMKSGRVEYEVTDTNFRFRKTERLAISPDGKALAVHRGADRSPDWMWKEGHVDHLDLTTLWRTKSGRWLSELPTDGKFEQLSFLPDGTLVGNSDSGGIEQWVPVNLPAIHYGWNVDWFEAVKFGRMLKRLGVVGEAIDVHVHLGRGDDKCTLSFALSEQVIADAEITAALHKKVGPQLAAAGWGPHLVVNLCDKNFQVLESHVVQPAPNRKPLKPVHSVHDSAPHIHVGAKRFQIVKATPPRPVDKRRRSRARRR